MKQAVSALANGPDPMIFADSSERGAVLGGNSYTGDHRKKENRTILSKVIISHERAPPLISRLLIIFLFLILDLWFWF